MFGSLALIVYFWDFPDAEKSFIVSPYLFVFFNTFHPRVSFCFKSLEGRWISAIRPKIANFERTWLYGRLLLDHFVTTHFTLFMDSDIYMVKPWLAPLVEDITGPNQTDKIFFAGIDRGLIQGVQSS
jgi:hypothetical protein